LLFYGAVKPPTLTLIRSDPDLVLRWIAREAGRRRSGAANVAPEEYDFGGVPETELRSCIHYEYARECDPIVREVANIRRQSFPMVDEAGNLKSGDTRSLRFRRVRKWSKEDLAFDIWILMALAGEAGFPETAWTKLQADAKARLVESLPNVAIEAVNANVARKYPPLVVETEMGNAELAGLTLAAWKAKVGALDGGRSAKPKSRPLQMSGFFTVGLAYDAEVIVESFRKWLLDGPPQLASAKRERRGRHSLRDGLNALGALRLRYLCRNLSEAQDLMMALRRTRPDGPSYRDRTSWNRACTGAVDVFRQVLHLPDTERPLHFSAGWQK